MRYAGLIKDDVNNGAGIGLTLFTQYCPHRCPGCHNPETWNKDGGKEFTAETFDEIFDYFETRKEAVRLTLSGGDPLANLPLTTVIAEEFKKRYPNKKLWVYTGYIFENLIKKEEYQNILGYIDVMIDGPFILAQRDITLPFRGSSNQRIIDVQKSLEKGEIVLYE